MIAGTDEVGRGCLAGAVVAAAVILPPHCRLPVRDSKKISPKKRQALAEQIKEQALAWSIGRAEVNEIDRLNILQASLLAMQRAVQALPIEPTMVWIDGIHRPDLKLPMITSIKGDDYITCLSAASILAKVSRDDEMMALDAQYPEYGFGQHKGYPTRQHLQALARHGISPVHRRSFKPVQSYA